MITLLQQVSVINVISAMMSVTKPKLDRSIFLKENDSDNKAVRKISQMVTGTIRPSRVSTVSRRDRTVSVSSREPDKYSSSSLDQQTRSVRLENTYQLAPDPKFQVEKVKSIVQEVLEMQLHDVKYDPITSAKQCISLSNLIKEKVKLLNMKRYKIVCAVLITQRGQQSMSVASRFCWDKENDNFISVSYSQPTLHAFGTVFGVYLD